MGESSMELELSIAGVTTQIKIKNQEDKQAYLDVMNELNKECNDIMIECGNIDKTILLCCVLFNTNIYSLNDVARGDLFFNFVKTISKYIEEKNNENVRFEDKIKQIRRNLVVINIISRMKLNKNRGEVKSDEINEDELNKIIEKFTSDIKNDIELVKNDFLL